MVGRAGRPACAFARFVGRAGAGNIRHRTPSSLLSAGVSALKKTSDGAVSSSRLLYRCVPTEPPVPTPETPPPSPGPGPAAPGPDLDGDGNLDRWEFMGCIANEGMVLPYDVVVSDGQTFLDVSGVVCLAGLKVRYVWFGSKFCLDVCVPTSFHTLRHNAKHQSLSSLCMPRFTSRRVCCDPFHSHAHPGMRVEQNNSQQHRRHTFMRLGGWARDMLPTFLVVAGA